MIVKLRIILATICALLVAATALAMHHAIKVSSKEGLGNYLTDSEGKTLYWFTKDSVGQSACPWECIDKWPIFYHELVTPPEGVAAADFTIITRSDGKKQTAFRGYPLYYFARDKTAGDTAGQGVKDAWFVIDPANFPVK